MHQLLNDPWFWAAAAGFLLSCVASALPSPEKDDSKGYVFAYRLVQALSANWDRISAKKS